MPPAEQECRLLGGFPAWLAQACLGLMALATLLYKRHKEKPQRPVDVWLYDVSKQVISMLAAHICGILIATLMALSGKRHVSECAWYFVAFTFDTTLGVALTLAIHKTALKFAENRRSDSTLFSHIADCGSYGTPPQWSVFWPQLVEWVLAVLLARFICGLVVLILKPWLLHAAGALDILFGGSPILFLYFVMICCPLLMNLFQALIQDMALKWREHFNRNESELAEIPSVTVSMTTLASNEKAPLFAANSQPS